MPQQKMNCYFNKTLSNATIHPTLGIYVPGGDRQHMAKCVTGSRSTW